MRKTYQLGLALIAVFACSAVAASGAFALESVFLVNAATVTKEVPVTSELKAGTELLLEDMKVPILGAVDITCTNVTSKGAVGVGTAPEKIAKFDLVNTVTFTLANCKSKTSGATLTAISAVNLPWLTELVLSGAIFLDNILPISGQPGYKITVSTLLGSETDECGSSTKNVEVENSGSNILGIFNETETANCTIGGTGAGLIVGTNVFKTESGESLAVSEG
jgi:hypothetical protein